MALKHKPLLAGIVLASVFAVPAFAQYSNPPAAKPAATTTTTTTTTTTASPGWAELDANKDGNLTKDEASKNPGLAAVFDKADANADGSLTGDEYRAYAAANPPASAGGEHSAGGDDSDSGQH